MNWIRQDKRLAIYLRDGLACVWCGIGIEDGSVLTLDHVKPHSKDGSNEAHNLVTSCKRCNSSRGVRTVPQFAKAVAIYLNHGVNPVSIVKHVHATRERILSKYRKEAQELLSRRGSVAKVLQEVTT